ncbi:murein transglycosylase [Roseovarius sp. TE539]|uniref:murein transglycosylase A n=1 Tax=Roseovarius sp. TE539 TaxID=2249812 RepID=UPI000DE021A6|nr:murein transglycosylase A [Roseovarius sp. TE539]RBI77637.1 murein transglycosylase [Roseovarius sp. TE539]
MTRAIRTAIGFWIAMAGTVMASDLDYEILDFEDLAGWEEDDHQQALDVFLDTCPDMTEPDWKSLCALAQQKPDARDFFELFFRPVVISNDDRALFTGYYEPELEGALSESDRFKYPLYRAPDSVQPGTRWLSRKEIETGPAMKGRGLEIAWVDDPVELFFLQVQGSGRIRLPDGRNIRVGYGGSNGHDYRSVGREMVRRGIYSVHQVSADVIKSWVRRNPRKGRDLLHHNPSYVFFRRVDEVPADEGPLGAMNRSITAGRSIAVDPDYTPLGAPVWLEKAGKDPINRLMIAQDTGSAIKGPQRADIFFGTGDKAGRRAGHLRDGGRMAILLPIQRAYAMRPEVPL